MNWTFAKRPIYEMRGRRVAEQDVDSAYVRYLLRLAFRDAKPFTKEEFRDLFVVDHEMVAVAKEAR